MEVHHRACVDMYPSAMQTVSWVGGACTSLDGSASSSLRRHAVISQLCYSQLGGGCMHVARYKCIIELA